MNHLNSDKLFQNAFHFAVIGMALVGLDGRWLKVNRSLCELVGYSEAELSRLTFQDITHPDDLDLDLAYLDRLVRGEIPSYQMEKRYYHKAGNVVWVLLHVALVRDQDDRPEVFISQIKDITLQKQAELVRETIFELPLALHFVAGFDGYFKKLSASWSDALGYPLDYLLSVPYLDFVHPEDREGTVAASQQLSGGSHVFLFENRYRHSDGSYRWLLWASLSVAEQQSVYGVALDYTAKKEAELKLEHAFHQMERLVSDLRLSHEKVDKLREGLLTVCAWTKRVQHEGRWMSVDEFLRDQLGLTLTHGISQEAFDKVKAEISEKRASEGLPE